MGFLNDIIQKAQTFAESDKGKELIEKGETFINQKTGAQPPTGAAPTNDYKDGYNQALADAVTALKTWAEQQQYIDVGDLNDWETQINALKQ